jgi:ankyrin repeat protein
MKRSREMEITHLMTLCVNESVEEAIDFISKCEKKDLSQTDYRGRTAVHYASQKNTTAPILAFLLEKGEIAATTDKSDETPLHVAAREGASDCIRLLLQAKVPLNLKSRGKGDTALILASCHGRIECVKRLLNSGVYILILHS